MATAARYWQDKRNSIVCFDSLNLRWMRTDFTMMIPTVSGKWIKFPILLWATSWPGCIYCVNTALSPVAAVFVRRDPNWLQQNCATRNCVLFLFCGSRMANEEDSPMSQMLRMAERHAHEAMAHMVRVTLRVWFRVKGRVRVADVPSFPMRKSIQPNLLGRPHPNIVGTAPNES